MTKMKECRFKKRLQIYIDGWMEEREAKEFEEHIKVCAQCQIELAEMEEVNSAALDIVDEAPEREYWDSFATRVRNRIVARSAAPVMIKKRTPVFLGFRLAAVFTGVLAVASIMLIVMRYGTAPSPVPTATTPSHPNAAAIGNHAANLPQATSHASIVSPAIPPMNESDLTKPADDQAAPIPKDNKADKSGELASRDLGTEFKGQPLIDKAEFKYDDTYQSLADLSAANHNNGEKGYRLKASILGERLLAGLSQNGSNEISTLYHGSFYSLRSDGSSDKWVGISNEDLVTWGYMRIPSDTSKSGEIRKYLIELELMQTR